MLISLLKNTILEIENPILAHRFCTSILNMEHLYGFRVF